MKKLLALAFALSLFGGSALFATDEPFNVDVQLVAAITIAETQALTFGQQTIAAGTVVKAPDGTTGTNGEKAAAFTVTGSNTINYRADVVNATTTLTSGANTVSVGTYLLKNAAGVAAKPFDGTFGAGAETIYVGATLTLAGTEPAGTYTGTNTLRVTYR